MVTRFLTDFVSPVNEKESSSQMIKERGMSNDVVVGSENLRFGTTGSGCSFSSR